MPSSLDGLKEMPREAAKVSIRDMADYMVGKSGVASKRSSIYMVRT